MNEYGSEIAYQVRFEGTSTAKTRALFLTEVNNEFTAKYFKPYSLKQQDDIRVYSSANMRMIPICQNTMLS